MARLDVRKTHKLYIGGDFPRSESGRTFPALDDDGNVIARMAEGSRKDLRDAVRAARGAQEKWAARTGYNRGQILYRIAEMVEDRAAAFQDDLRVMGASKRAAERQVEATIDRLVWYAGWCDKFPQVFGNLNPVAGPFFNISSPEPTGVVGVIAPHEPPLLGLVSRLAPVLVPGNTAVVVASDRAPVVAVTFAEALATSDVPAGVVNILTGHAAELTPWLASHMDVNAIDLTGCPDDLIAEAETAAADNVKRVVRSEKVDSQSPLLIAAFTETKTVWHPKGL
ncbi:MAG TPA: aldehyde dehydrogenase family protein [Acidimicrobiia bacterium]|nr:aldehyde dehydrogenase family protein [Acidimicrobiia bacterium]